ncbi:MAG: hypothetical protein GWP08_01395 [Nitrospiraceae bacterium]|nr:hypothetical protein [Nitrospiraceae bacterium]
MLAAGCATGPKGPSDEELVKLQAQVFLQGLLDGDIDAALMAMSDDFYHPEVGDKEAFKAIGGQAVAAGYFEDGEMDLQDAEPLIEGTKADIYPCVLSSSQGSLTFGMTMTKEATGWMITELDIEGL